MSPLILLALVDGAAGAYLLRRVLRPRRSGPLLITAIALLLAAAALAWIGTLPQTGQPGWLPPLPGRLV